MRTVAFDVDGVLIDTLSVHQRVWRSWAQSHRLDTGVVWRSTLGRRPEDTIAEVAPDLDLTVERRELDRLLAAEEPHVEAMAGARELLEALTHRRWAIVTSGSRDTTTERFRRLGLALPSVAVYGEDVEHGKPHPEPYLSACRHLGLAPADCLVVEDAPAGIAAGKAAGCTVIALATTCPRSELGEADEVCESLEVFAARFRELVA